MERQSFAFGPFTFDRKRRLLLRQGEPVRLSVDSARNVLNIQEKDPVAIATHVQKSSGNVAAQIRVPQTTIPMPLPNIPAVQQATFASTGNDSKVQPIVHQTPVVPNSSGNLISSIPVEATTSPQLFKSNPTPMNPEYTPRSTAPSSNPLRGVATGNPLRRN